MVQSQMSILSCFKSPSKILVNPSQLHHLPIIYPLYPLKTHKITIFHQKLLLTGPTWRSPAPRWAGAASSLTRPSRAPRTCRGAWPWAVGCCWTSWPRGFPRPWSSWTRWWRVLAVKSWEIDIFAVDFWRFLHGFHAMLWEFVCVCCFLLLCFIGILSFFWRDFILISWDLPWWWEKKNRNGSLIMKG